MEYVGQAVGVIILSMIIIVFLFIYPMFPIQSDLSNFAREVVRVAEMKGTIDIDVNSMKEDYNVEFADTKFTYDSFKGTEKVQYGDKITFTCVYPYKINILGFDIEIPLRAKSTGVSEVYWK